MREFLLNSEELLDKNAVKALVSEEIPGVLPCKWVRYNDRIQLLYFTDIYTALSKTVKELSMEDRRDVIGQLLDYVTEMEGQEELSPENVLWNLEDIYIDTGLQVHIICLPAVLPQEVLTSRIYIKRVYALIEDICGKDEEGRFVCRQIEEQRKKEETDWEGIKFVLDIEETKEDSKITLRGINTPIPIEFTVDHGDFFIGSGEDNDGIIDLPSVSPRHALIGWNDISFYIEDKDSRDGTFLNDVQLFPNMQTPFGKGSIIRLGEYIFNVE